MKKTILSLSIVLLTLAACKKKDSTPVSVAPTTTGTVSPSTSSFTWTENGGTTNTADSAFWTTGAWGTGIRAYKGGMANFFEVNWATQNNTSVGTKTLDFTNYGFTFLKGSATYTISSNQNLTVSAFSNDKLSGNFTVAVAGGTVTSIAAGFNTLSKK